MSPRYPLTIAGYVLLAGALAIIGCPGAAPGPLMDEDDTMALSSSGSGSTAVDATCTADGNPAVCDHVTGEGCQRGFCYLLAAEGPACLCRAGKRALNQPCETTSQCMPGNVCIGKSLPGRCLQACYPLAIEPSCPEGTRCIPIESFDEFGFCKPQAMGPGTWN